MSFDSLGLFSLLQYLWWGESGHPCLKCFPHNPVPDKAEEADWLTDFYSTILDRSVKVGVLENI